jgi:hypothetical protein
MSEWVGEDWVEEAQEGVAGDAVGMREWSDGRLGVVGRGVMVRRVNGCNFPIFFPGNAKYTASFLCS